MDDTLSARDLENLQKSLAAAIDRGAFKDGELEVIKPLNRKLKNFVDTYNTYKEQNDSTSN